MGADRVVFATDLDRTLIFSGKKISESERGLGLRCVEYLDGHEHTYLTEKAYDLLQSLKESAIVIPVTSRVIEKYERVELGYFEWAIVGNGTTILHNGNTYEPWDTLLDLEYSKHKSRIDESILLLHKLSVFGSVYKVGSWNKGLIQTARVDVGQEEYVLSEIQKINTDNFFIAYLDELNRLILVPEFVQKERALEFILKSIDYKRLITAGDGILDLNMLKMADECFTQRGCPVEELISFDYTVVNYGVTGVEEMLVRILGDIKKNIR